MHRHSSLLLLACLPLLLGGCFQQLDAGAAGELPCDFGNVCPPPADGTIPVMTSTPPILLADGRTTTDPCVKVLEDSRAIRKATCAGCHDGQGALGAPLTFVLDDDACAQKESSPKYMRQRYVVPGDPEHSLIYQRAVVVGDMPPTSTDVANGNNPRPSISDYSVLRQWIMCLSHP